MPNPHVRQGAAVSNNGGSIQAIFPSSPQLLVNPIAGDQWVVLCADTKNSLNPPTDTQGNVYTLVDSNNQGSGGLQVWTATIKQSAPCTITLNTTVGDTNFLLVLEYIGMFPFHVSSHNFATVGTSLFTGGIATFGNIHMLSYGFYIGGLIDPRFGFTGDGTWAGGAGFNGPSGCVNIFDMGAGFFGPESGGVASGTFQGNGIVSGNPIWAGIIAFMSVIPPLPPAPPNTNFLTPTPRPLPWGCCSIDSCCIQPDFKGVY